MLTSAMVKCSVLALCFTLFVDPSWAQSTNAGFFGALAANFAQIFQRRTSTPSEPAIVEPVTVYLTQYETVVQTETERLTETETSTLSLSWLRWTTQTEREFLTETVTETTTSVDVSLLVSVAVVTLTERSTAYQTVTSTATSVSLATKTMYSEYIVTEIASKCPTYTVSVGMLQRHGEIEEDQKSRRTPELHDELHFSEEELGKVDDFASSQLQNKNVLNNKNGQTFKVDEFVQLKPSAMPTRDLIDIDDMDLMAMQRHLELELSPDEQDSARNAGPASNVEHLAENRDDIDVVDIDDLDLVDGFLRRSTGQLTSGAAKLPGTPNLIKHSSIIESSFPSRQRQFDIAENSQADITADLQFRN
ncbi:uncharacterized protein LOC130698148 [Daphnia carinata]|uniref:uncharacterized protein LOC130698148 n=1 Tax=Daphnia carinata TaxID=120202 RepID=UPI00257CEC76|nr:uncharacterized protein LOC130698148 [Daphnia carinata]